MDARGWAITVWIFYLVSYFTAGFSSLVSDIIAYMKRGDLAATEYDSHMTSAIRTFGFNCWEPLSALCLLWSG